MGLIEYLLFVTVCLSICFLFYKLVFKTTSSFKQLRFTLLLSVILSLSVPFSNYQINFVVPFGKKIVNSEINNIDEQLIPEYNNSPPILEAGDKKGSLPILPFREILKYGYLLVSTILLLRIVLQLIVLIFQFVKSEKIYQDNCVFVYNNKFENTFSFFNCIFIPNKLKENKEINGILMHEKVHASQYHSLDILVFELLAAVMWFNPFIWMMRKEMQLVHEYLADEGALSTGIDRLKYQALLINQVTEERLICLSSSFNHSLIKKRMIMMTKQKFNQQTKLRILTLIPLAAILLLGMACVNGQNTKKENVVASIAPTKMNVMYIGIDNPIKVAVSGYNSSELEVSVTNAKIKGSNGNYIVNPRRPRNIHVIVMFKGDTLQKTEFRVKKVPSPVAKINGKTGGGINKHVLLAQIGVEAALENFNFDLSFKVVEFTLSTTLEGKLREIKSNSYKITDEQKELIAELDKGQRLYIQDIKAEGPDGSIRGLSSISLLLN